MCKVHPRYKGVRRPRLACEGCWRLWFKKDTARMWQQVAKKILMTEGR